MARPVLSMGPVFLVEPVPFCPTCRDHPIPPYPQVPTLPVLAKIGVSED
eukprot:CAMPEP_0194337706 /NCGR_PEP_ID=MMETSP0171-20130528/77171_1 /TAXON_ID=218684 /ORGANISM="Corethron pennatum, Strain L29A3" /LENGTH=48 /DNA_ID= /DNA_START= /DNA_END= /DNA_ORIENTATION=